MYFFFFLQTSLAVPSPKSGIIEELLVEDGTTVEQGTPLFKLKLTGRLNNLFHAIFDKKKLLQILIAIVLHPRIMPVSCYALIITLNIQQNLLL